ncbi:amino acid adenylation domain-containing protein, partial [Streptomyces violaceusniger]|uniref:amino acid adenylation domain-containing protein n=1 Tax=Streptomyces violaceusniger TaxID=68280 RepID=UPI0037F2220E
FAHQDVPFERLVEVVNPQRSAARHPLFQVMLNLQNNPEPQLALDGVTVEPQPVDVAVSKFDLSVDLTEHHGGDGAASGVHGEIRYSVDLFDRETVEGMVARFVRLLEAVVADPEVRLGGVEILSGQERSRLLTEWNGPVLEVPVRSLPALVEAQVARTPEAVALIEGGVSLSYREVNARANRLARLLVGMGVGPERMVALALPRSVSQVVALLAVVKAGGAYLPVDPEYPAERISYMLGDAAPALLLTDRATAAGLPETSGLMRVVLDEEETGARVDALAETDLGDGERLVPLSVDHPAYVIYTSGSTGRPKGVVVTHRSLSDYLDWTSRSYPSAAGAALLHSPVSFDLSVTALYTPLVAGGAVHLAALEENPTAERALAGRPVTFLKATPSHLPLLAALPDAFSPGNELLLGGEALFGEALRDWRRRHPGATVLNVYGPTEGTVNVAEFRIEPGDEVPSGPVPIGLPQGNARLYVLDEGLRLTPPGVAGELYIAGTALARGYLNRAALTAERFVADPYGAPGARMYRTGDLARRRADGNLEYVGRADDQVKVRGFRIELGEIETVLAGHPDVERAVVVVREDQPGERRLIGYAVPAAGARPDPAALRARVADAVPDYMVPAAVVLLDALPLTAHGKLDRTALPAPDFAATVTKQGPRTPQEEILCEIFADLLDLSEVGVHDSFFDLGGDSIISIQLVSRARKAGLSLTPRAVFQHKTVEALASHAGTVGKRVGKGTDTGVGSVPLTPIIHRLRERGGPIGKYAQSVLLQVPADLGEGPLETTVQTVLDHHDALRMRLTRPEGGGEWSLEVPPRGTVRAAESLTRVDVAGLSADALRAVIETEGETAWARLSPEQGRMLQAVWFDAGPETSGRLLVIIHHLVVDGVSWRILETDLEAVWQAAKEGRPAELQPVGTSFRRWAEHLVASAYASERVKEAELWSSTLDVPDPLLSERPLDPSQDMNHTMGGLWQILPPELTGPVLTKVPAAFNAGINDVLLTALALAVAQWRLSRGGEDHPAVLVDLEGHGREEFTDGVDLSRTVGWFSSIYPVRLDPGRLDWREVLAGGPAVGDALKRVKEQLRGTPDNGLGFGLLRHLNLDTKPVLAGFLPRQIGFNYLGRFDMAGRAEYADWAPAPEKAPGFSDQDAPMMYALSLNAVTEDHADGPRLRVAWAFPGALFREPDIKELSEIWAQVLQALVTHVEGGASGGHTPSDLPLVSLSQQEIDELEDELDDESDEDELDEEWGITR